MVATLDTILFRLEFLLLQIPQYEKTLPAGEGIALAFQNLKMVADVTEWLGHMLNRANRI